MTSSQSKRFDVAAVVEHYNGRPVPERSGFVKVTCPTGEHEDNTPSATVNRPRSIV